MRVEVIEESQPGEARREAQVVASSLGFDEQGVGRVSLLVNELTRNLVKHATDGELLILPIERGAARGLDLVAIDRGPGIADIVRAQRDGYSTAGSPGTGLGAISRIADEFDLYSEPTRGTVVVARIWSGQVSNPSVLVGSVALPLQGESVSGDAFAVREDPMRLRVCLADGLGHGVYAREASDAAIAEFRREPNGDPGELLLSMHLALRPTRGAAVAIADIDLDSRVLRFAGAGNIAAVVHSNGIGEEPRLAERHRRPLALPDQMSSSIPSRRERSSSCTRTAAEPLESRCLSGRSPPRSDDLAALLYRDFARGRDDITVFVARDAPEP